MPIEPATMSKLDELLAAIRGFEDPRRASDEWKQVFKLLLKAGLPAGTVNGVVGMRDLARLSELVEQLRGSAGGTPAPAGAPDAETCRLAMRAFRKRATLTRLDEESKLGHSPLSKGDVPTAAAIVPPVEFPRSVWDELVRQGRLRCIGHGLYEEVSQE